MKSNFSSNFKNLLKRNKIKQKDIAEILDINVTTISKWVNGYFIPESKHLQKIANFFEINIEELLGTDKVTVGNSTTYNEIVEPSVMQSLKLIEYTDSLGYSVSKLDEDDWNIIEKEIKNFIGYQFYKINHKDDEK